MRESDFLPWGKLAAIAQQCPVHTMSCVDFVVHRAILTVAAVTVWAGTTWKLSVCLCVCVCVFSAGDETAEDRTQQKMERLKKRALSSSMMDELRRDFMDEPEEIVVSTLSPPSPMFVLKSYQLTDVLCVCVSVCV